MPFTTSYTQAEMPKFLSEAYARLAGMAEATNKLPGQQRQYGVITPEEAASMTPEELAAAKEAQREIANLPEDILRSHALGRREGLNVPFIERAQSLGEAASQGFPAQADAYMNPYMQHVVNPIREMAERGFREQTLPALSNAFISAGMHGGGRHADLAARAARDMEESVQREQGRALASGYSQAANIYGTDMARKLDAARQSADLGDMMQAGNIKDAAALEAQGRYQQQQEQSHLDVNRNRFLRQQAAPWEAMSREQSILSGVPVTTNQSTIYQTPPTPQVNTMGQIGALGTGLYGMRNMMGQGGFKRGGAVRARKMKKITNLMSDLGCY